MSSTLTAEAPGRREHQGGPRRWVPRSPLLVGERRLRARGAALGAGIGVAIALIGMGSAWIVTLAGGDDPRIPGLITLAGFVGVPVGAFLGWRRALAVVEANLRRVAILVALMALQAVVLGSFLVAWVIIVPAAIGTPYDTMELRLSVIVLTALVVPLFGLVLYGLPALAVTLPAVALWALLTRRFSGREHAGRGGGTPAPSAHPMSTS